MICAPFSTCWRATASASSKRPSRIIFAKARLPVTLVRSPMLTNSDPAPIVSGSRPARRIGAISVAGGTTGLKGATPGGLRAPLPPPAAAQAARGLPSLAAPAHAWGHRNAPR